MFNFGPSDLELIRDYPHLLGHICGWTKLVDLHSDWIKLCWDAPAGENVGIMSHRGGFKTTAITQVGTLYWLLFHPSDRIAIIRETYTEAIKTVDTIKRCMQLEAVQALFSYAYGRSAVLATTAEGHLVLSAKRTITKEGSIDAYGINQVPTGSHYDRIICDDIVTINSRLSRAARERVKEGVKEIVTNIIDPGKSVYFVGTPWHYDDAWAMKNDSGELIIPAPYKYKPEDTGILSAEEIAAKKATTTKALYAINYDLDTSIRDEGQIFDEPIRGIWDATLPAVRYHAHVDAAFGGGCTNSLTLMAKRDDGLIQARGWVWAGSIVDLIPNICSILRLNRCRNIHLETNPDKGFVGREFRSQGALSVPIVSTYAESMNKDIKIISYLKKYWGKIVWDQETMPEYLLQIQDYRPGQDPRDCADSAASLLRQAFYPSDPDVGGNVLNQW